MLATAFKSGFIILSLSSTSPQKKDYLAIGKQLLPPYVAAGTSSSHAETTYETYLESIQGKSFAGSPDQRMPDPRACAERTTMAPRGCRRQSCEYGDIFRKT